MVLSEFEELELVNRLNPDFFFFLTGAEDKANYSSLESIRQL